MYTIRDRLFVGRHFLFVACEEMPSDHRQKYILCINICVYARAHTILGRRPQPNLMVCNGIVFRNDPRSWSHRGPSRVMLSPSNQCQSRCQWKRMHDYLAPSSIDCLRTRHRHLGIGGVLWCNDRIATRSASIHIFFLLRNFFLVGADY